MNGPLWPSLPIIDPNTSCCCSGLLSSCSCALLKLKTQIVVCISPVTEMRSCGATSGIVTCFIFSAGNLYLQDSNALLLPDSVQCLDTRTLVTILDLSLSTAFLQTNPPPLPAAVNVIISGPVDFLSLSPTHV